MARLWMILNNHLFPASLLRGFEEALLATVPEPSYLLMPTITTKWADDDGGDDRYKDGPEDLCMYIITTKWADGHD